MKGLGALLQQRHQLAAARRRYPLRRLAALLRLRPILDGRAGDGENVAARLLRHRPGACEPFLNPARAGIVGGGRQSQIAELVAQLVQKLRRFRQRLHRIEGIEQAALAGGSRHELRDPLRALAAARHRPDRVRAESGSPARSRARRIPAEGPTPWPPIRSSGTSPRARRFRAPPSAGFGVLRPGGLACVLGRWHAANAYKSDTVQQRARRYRSLLHGSLRPEMCALRSKRWSNDHGLLADPSRLRHARFCRIIARNPGRRSRCQFTLTPHFTRRALSQGTKRRKSLLLYREISMLDRRESVRDKVMLWRRRRDRRAWHDARMHRPQYLRQGRHHRIQQRRRASKGAAFAAHRAQGPLLPGQGGLVARQFRRRRLPRREPRRAGLRPRRTVAQKRDQEAPAPAPYRRPARPALNGLAAPQGAPPELNERQAKEKGRLSSRPFRIS